MKMTHRVYGKPMMTKRTIIYPDRLGSKCIILFGGRRSIIPIIYHIYHSTSSNTSFLYKSNFADGNA